MLKILQVAAPTPAGGLERVVESLAIGHHRRGHHVAVAALVFGPAATHPFVELLEGEGVPVHPIRLSARSYLRERRELADLFANLRPDVVHTHGYRIDILDRPVAAVLGLPTVTTVHGASKMGGLKGALFEWLQRRSYRKFDAVVAVSAPLHDAALKDGVHPDRLHLIPNAWSGLREPMPRAEARREMNLPENARVLGWVGRHIHVKGADTFLKALSLLPEPRPLGVLIGYGPEADRTRRQAEQLRLLGSVRFYPQIRDASRYFRAFDSYVLSSRSEGLPLVVLEAMAAGTPIVATRVGGVEDALGEGNGWLVPSEDPRALADAMAASLSDPAEAERRARRASKRLQRRFSLDTFLDRYEKVYRRLAAEGG